jgi:hypothetical protein
LVLCIPRRGIIDLFLNLQRFFQLTKDTLLLDQVIVVVIQMSYRAVFKFLELIRNCIMSMHSYTIVIL